MDAALAAVDFASTVSIEATAGVAGIEIAKRRRHRKRKG
jgi:hypothetical protein